MEAKLVVVGGDAKVSEIKLRLPAIIGRGRGAGILLRHPLVSRQHCEIYEVEGQLRVRDMGSLNGTFVGNRAITDAALPPGELLTVGTVTFRAVYGDAPDLSTPLESPSHSAKPAPGDKTLPDPAGGTMRASDMEDEVKEIFEALDESTPLNDSPAPDGPDKTSLGPPPEESPNEAEKNPGAHMPATSQEDALSSFLRNLGK